MKVEWQFQCMEGPHGVRVHDEQNVCGYVAPVGDQAVDDSRT